MTCQVPKTISGISRHPASYPPCLPAENTLVFGSSSRRMDYLPGMVSGNP